MNMWVVRWQKEDRTDGWGFIKSEFFKYKEAIDHRKEMKNTGMFNVTLTKEKYNRGF